MMDSVSNKDGLIDVKKLIASYSIEQHMAQADAYFAGHGDSSALLRKPFQTPAEAAQILQGLSIMLKELRLFGGVRVVDFGAGTAWLSRMLAYLNCEAIAIDLSRSALELGRRAIEKDIFAKNLKISFLPYDGVRIPLPDAHVERICCFDSFHHVADQRATLAEFFRIMKPGAIAAFHEPGPSHSRTPEAQSEMAAFKVIENDIVVEDIAGIAREVGFDDMKVAWYSPNPLLMEVKTFNKLIGTKSSAADHRRVAEHASAALQGMRIFFLYKPGVEVTDSRVGSGLTADLKVRLESRDDNTFRGSLSVRNTGSAVWLPSGGELGSVAVGVHLADAAGKLVDLDYARLHLADTPVRPQETRAVSFMLPAPTLQGYKLVFDLVSEHVTWFAQTGSNEVTIDSEDLPA